MDTLQGERWTPPWTGPTIWVVTMPDWEWNHVVGVSSTIEGAWELLREKKPDGRDYGFVFWKQDGNGTVTAERFVIEPYELRDVKRGH